MVVDGQAVFRSGLARLLGEDDRLEVVAVSEGGPEVPELCAAMSVDVVVTDLRLPKMDGIELIRRVSAVSPSTRILVVASAADWGVVPAIGSGAAGFLLKDAEPEAIMSAVVAVHLGEQVLCREAINWVNGKASVRRLTRRETEVLTMIAQGVGNKEIAERLQLGEKTVRNYVSPASTASSPCTAVPRSRPMRCTPTCRETPAPTTCAGRPAARIPPERKFL